MKKSFKGYLSRICISVFVGVENIRENIDQGLYKTIAFKFLIGFLVGWVIDALIEKSAQWEEEKKQRKIENSFEFNLLVLCAVVIKTQETNQREKMNFVVRRFVQFFGREKTNEVVLRFNNSTKQKEFNLPYVCRIIVARSTYKARIDALDFLLSITKVSGETTQREVLKIEEMAKRMRVLYADFDAVRNKYVKKYTSQDVNYAILGLERQSSRQQVKDAYRKLVLKFHPDKQIGKTEKEKQYARERFSQIQKAYQAIMQ